ncbi:unnamed protein product [marine sediment metagenome]|uniref:Uncharacterized protein n=1 Tax=marine sediment metagenome TaxID=412755 RepID=X1VLE1_9ZZZZ
MILVTLHKHKGTDKISIILTHTENITKAKQFASVPIDESNTALVSDFEYERLLDKENAVLTLSVHKVS